MESYNMDAILQIFKRSIYPGTPFFESLVKNLLAMMDGLFRWENKYSMLEDDVCVAILQVLFTNRSTKNDHAWNSKPSNQLRQAKKGRDDQQQLNQASLTPLSISYKKLLPMIRDLFDFRWSELIKMDPAKRDQSKRCVYHKDHGHNIEQCRSLHYLVERLIRVEHLKQYVHTTGRQWGTTRDLIIQAPTTLIAPRAVINYIHGGPIDEKYNSKQKRQKLLPTASVRE